MYASENLIKAMEPIPGKCSQGKNVVCNLRNSWILWSPIHRTTPTLPLTSRLNTWARYLGDLCQSQYPKVVKTSGKLPGREPLWSLNLHELPYTDQFDGGGVLHNRVGRKRQHDELCGWCRGTTLTGILWAHGENSFIVTE